MKGVSRLERVQSVLNRHHQPPFRFLQVRKAIFQQKVLSFSAMSTLPTAVREDLVGELGESTVGLQVSKVSESSQATKVLFELSDGNKVEAVCMHFRNGSTSLCISSQVGCALKCSFCATGAMGLKRNMTADEITDQVLYFQQRGKQISSISFMGMGEPLQNPRVFDALQTLTDKDLFSFPQRRISVSTVGVVSGINKLTKELPGVNLAFSLHSPFPEQRDQLVPANRTQPLDACLEALEQHALATRRKVFLAYLVLDGFNDSDEHAQEINRLLKRMHPSVRHLFHVNLARYNPAFGIEGPFIKTNENNLRRFMTLLQTQYDISVTARQSFGVDIDAACGQLFATYQKKPDLGRSSPPLCS